MELANEVPLPVRSYAAKIYFPFVLEFSFSVGLSPLFISTYLSMPACSSDLDHFRLLKELAVHKC
jgi:hypothetical protein